MNKPQAFKRTGAILAVFLAAAAAILAPVSESRADDGCKKGTVTHTAFMDAKISNVRGSDIYAVNIDFCVSRKDPSVILLGSDLVLRDDAKAWITRVAAQKGYSGRKLVDHEDQQVLVASIGGATAGVPTATAVARAKPTKTPTMVAAAGKKPDVKKPKIDLANLKLPQPRPDTTIDMAAAQPAPLPAPVVTAASPVKAAAPTVQAQASEKPARGQVFKLAIASGFAKVATLVVGAKQIADTSAHANDHSPVPISMAAVAIVAGRSRDNNRSGRGNANRSRVTPLPQDPMIGLAAVSRRGSTATRKRISTGMAQVNCTSFANWPTLKQG